MIYFFSLVDNVCSIHLGVNIAFTFMQLKLSQNSSMFVLDLQKVDLVELVWLLKFGERFGGGHGWSRTLILLRSYDGLVTVECSTVFRS